MSTPRQKTAARRNIRKAAVAAKRRQTLKHLPRATRVALGKEAVKARKKSRR